jgi:hypothetical protein
MREPNEYCPADEDVTEDEPAVCADDEHDWRPAGWVSGDVECSRCGAEDSTFVAPAWADDTRW